MHFSVRIRTDSLFYGLYKQYGPLTCFTGNKHHKALEIFYVPLMKSIFQTVYGPTPYFTVCTNRTDRQELNTIRTECDLHLQLVYIGQPSGMMQS